MKIDKKIIVALTIGLVLGVLWFIAARFVLYKSDKTHFHANFALYINGQRDEFKNFTFYEEVQSCASDVADNPKHRVHMHDNISNVVHVHEPGVMWSHFFTNLGYVLGDDLIKTDQGIFVAGQDGNKLTFILNGQEVTSIANRPIKSEDSLLINFGSDDQATLQQRYDAITKDAAEFNKRNDPSSCTGTKELTFTERLKKAAGVGN